jgi:hypothetical protein
VIDWTLFGLSSVALRVTVTSPRFQPQVVAPGEVVAVVVGALGSAALATSVTGAEQSSEHDQHRDSPRQGLPCHWSSGHLGGASAQHPTGRRSPYNAVTPGKERL